MADIMPNLSKSRRESELKILEQQMNIKRAENRKYDLREEEEQLNRNIEAAIKEIARLEKTLNEVKDNG